jgi:hypothetical protein
MRRREETDGRSGWREATASAVARCLCAAAGRKERSQTCDRSCVRLEYSALLQCVRDAALVQMLTVSGPRSLQWRVAAAPVSSRRSEWSEAKRVQ